MANKRPVGRPKSSYKWQINGQGVKAQEFYSYKRNLKKIEANKKLNPSTLGMLSELIELRNRLEALIQHQMIIERH